MSLKLISLTLSDEQLSAVDAALVKGTEAIKPALLPPPLTLENHSLAADAISDQWLKCSGDRSAIGTLHNAR